MAAVQIGLPGRGIELQELARLRDLVIEKDQEIECLEFDLEQHQDRIEELEKALHELSQMVKRTGEPMCKLAEKCLGTVGWNL
jgi:predicted RNase H-like nuclease (RuvC/YqgF family)